MEQEIKQQSQIPNTMPLRIDMTIGDESSATRVAKVRHQGVEETVKVMNKVLRKMNAGVKLEIVKSAVKDNDAEELRDLGLGRINSEEPTVVDHT